MCLYHFVLYIYLCIQWLLMNLDVFPSAGTHIPPTQVQHTISDQDSSGASQSFRAAQNVGWTAESEQVISPSGY